MEIVKIPNSTITLKSGIVDKYACIVDDKIVYVGTGPQCGRYKKYNNNTKTLN